MRVADLLEHFRASKRAPLSPAEEAARERAHALRWNHTVQMEVLAAYAVLHDRTFTFFGGV